MTDREDEPEDSGPPRAVAVWIAVSGALLAGGAKFCAKRAPRLADDAAQQVRHVDEALDGVDGARRGGRLAEEGSIAVHIGETGVEEGVGLAVEEALSGDEGSPDTDEGDQ